MDQALTSGKTVAIGSGFDSEDDPQSGSRADDQTETLQGMTQLIKNSLKKLVTEKLSEE